MTCSLTLLPRSSGMLYDAKNASKNLESDMLDYRKVNNDQNYEITCTCGCVFKDFVPKNTEYWVACNNCSAEYFITKDSVKILESDMRHERRTKMIPVEICVDQGKYCSLLCDYTDEESCFCYLYRCELPCVENDKVGWDCFRCEQCRKDFGE